MDCEYCLQNNPVCKRRGKARMYINTRFAKTTTYLMIVGFIVLILFTITVEFISPILSSTQLHAVTVIFVLLLLLLLESRKEYEIFTKRIPYKCGRCGREAVRDESLKATSPLACKRCKETIYYVKTPYSGQVKFTGVMHMFFALYLVGSLIYISFFGSFAYLPIVFFNVFVGSILMFSVTTIILGVTLDTGWRKYSYKCAGCGKQNKMTTKNV